MSQDLRKNCLAIYRAGLRAADPYLLLRKHLAGDPTNGWRYDDESVLPPPGPGGRIRIFGAGKAAAFLGRALTESLPRQALSGRLIVKYGHGQPLRGVTVEEAGHPLPDLQGQLATERLLLDLKGTNPNDVIFFLLTGGASSLLVAPAEGITLNDKIETTQLLLSCGATIQEMNAIRKHLSRVKGGHLLEQMAPAAVFGIVVSDVVGNDLSSIGSGPTVPDPSTYADCQAILDRYQLTDRVPKKIRNRLDKGVRGLALETPKPAATFFQKGGTHRIIASNHLSLAAAEEKARSLGFEPRIFVRNMEGLVPEVARKFAQELVKIKLNSRQPTALLAGGELTLQVKGAGVGGRNQEFALWAALELEGRSGLSLLAAGTDGTDGPTDAAGAFADGTTVRRAKEADQDPRIYLTDNNSYPFFSGIGDLLQTGPTGTNVMDLVIGLAA